jgi:hypothetical protein
MARFWTAETNRVLQAWEVTGFHILLKEVKGSCHKVGLKKVLQICNMGPNTNSHLQQFQLDYILCPILIHREEV